MEFVNCLTNNREGILRSIDPQGDLLMYMLSEKLANYDDREQIKGRGSRRAMAEMILDLVAAKSLHDETVKERFLRCLQRSGQQHIVALLDEDHASQERIPAEARLMTEEQHDVILTQLVHLVRSMNTEGDLLCQLRSRGVLDDREIDRIRNQRSTDEMNEVLLTEILPLKSDAAFQGLVDALRASDQPHVANLLNPANACDEIPMSAEHRQFLSENAPYLVQHMDPRYDLIPLMIDRKIISCTDADRIQGHQTTSAMNEFILRVLARKPDSAFQKFIDALENSCQSHVLTNCYGHNVDVELKIVTQDPTQLNEAETAIEKELPSKLLDVNGNTIDGMSRIKVGMSRIKVRLRCHSTETLRRLWNREQEGRLDQVFQEPIREILDARGIVAISVTASIDPNEFNSCLSRLEQREMLEEHSRYLTMKQFDANLVPDDTLLENLCDEQVLSNQEFLQIRSQLTMDQRRAKLFDTLKRKPDLLFTKIKAAFENDPFRAIPRGLPSGNLNLASTNFDYLNKNCSETQDDYLRAILKKLKKTMENIEPLVKVSIALAQYNKSKSNEIEKGDSVNIELSNAMRVAVLRINN